MSFLDTIKQSVGSVFSSIAAGNVDSMIGLDIGSSAMKVVQLRRAAGGVTLETYGSIPLAPYAKGAAGDVVPMTEEVITGAITDLLRDARITATNAVVAIPAAASLLFTVSIPPIPESEYAAVITNEARKYIPVPLAEVSLDWWVLPAIDAPQKKEGEAEHANLTVLVAAIQTQVMNGYTSIVHKANLKAHSFEIELFSLVRSLVHRELGTVMLVDFGASGTRVAVAHEGVIRKTHTIHRGSQYLSQNIHQSLGISFEEAETLKKKIGLTNATTDSEKEGAKIIDTGIAYIMGELTGFLSQYERESHETIEKVIIAGGGSELIGLLPRLQSAFPVQVTVGKPFAKTQYPDFLEKMLETIGPEFSVATGLALRMVQ